MSHFRSGPYGLLPLLCLSIRLVWAETGFLVVHVSDVQDRPVTGLQLGLKGGGGSAFTGDDGNAKIPLAQGTQEHSFVSVQVVSSPRRRDLAILSPFDSRVEVPPFENKPENYVSVTVVERGDRAALAEGKVLANVIARVNKADIPQSASKAAPPVDPKANLEAVAKQYGYSADELDTLIKALKSDPKNPAQSGQQALYSKDYPKAAEQFRQALQEATGERREAGRKIAENAYFLGSSLYQQGKYEDAAAAYRRCLDIDPANAFCLNNTATAMEMAGHVREARPLYETALKMRVLQYGPDDEAADYKTNLGTVLERLGDYAGAEKLYNDALKVRRAKLSPDDPRIADSLNNMGGVLEAKQDYPTAESNYRQAIEIDGKALGQESPQVAIVKNNLAGVLRKERKYDEAEKEYREALQINRKVLPANHPEIALVLNNLAGLQKLRGNRAEAEDLYRQTLEIKQKVLAPGDPALAKALNNLGVLLSEGKKYSEAEPMFRQALGINRKAYGPVHPDVALTEYNLAILVRDKGDYAEAESLLRDALRIYQQMLGPNDPATQMAGRSLQALLQKRASGVQ